MSTGTDIGDWTQAIHQGDSFDLLDEMPGESVHAVVTDPPYGLNFMGRDWDNFRRRRNENDAGRDSVHGRMSSSAPASGAETDMHKFQDWSRRWATKAKRVLKPGGHLLAFSGNRTHHRLFSGVEDAGFEVRDTLTWHYGSGFPKALDVSKAIDKAADAEREVVGHDPRSKGIKPGQHNYGGGSAEFEAGHDITAPATDAAERWDGFKTGLKPATEFVVLARKPFDGTVAENVQEHGTAALNIGGTRVRVTGDEELSGGSDGGNSHCLVGNNTPNDRVRSSQSSAEKGRYPSNVVFDEQAAAQLDRDVGGLGESKGVRQDSKSDKYGEWKVRDPEVIGKRDTGGPSRYFYTSKASKAERTMDGTIENPHPTVKPVDLMEWLVTLATAEDQIVLDPFAGSGTTLRAAKNKARRFVGMERQAEWCDVARVRCGLTPDDPAVVRADDGQTGLEVYQ